MYGTFRSGTVQHELELQSEHNRHLRIVACNNYRQWSGARALAQGNSNGHDDVSSSKDNDDMVMVTATTVMQP